MLKRLLLLGLLYCSAGVLAQPMLESLRQHLDKAEEAPFSVSALFEAYKPSIYQIRVINQATGQKTSIGSGFLVGDGSLLATNYHVISDAIRKDNHVLEAVDTDDAVNAVELLGVDVIHDLALLKASTVLGKPFDFADIPSQGESLFALGNPHDLGFVIVDGINNGLLKKSARARVLFSGSLNSGMSGGPTLNRNGQVVGVNVAYLRQGNDISFVIPAEYLQAILKQENWQEMTINQAITAQLFADNEQYFRPALDSQWPETVIGQYQVPLAMGEDVKCWDSSPEPDIDDLLAMEAVTCFNDRATFINNDVTVGQMGYSYSYFYAREPILRARFYRLYSQYYKLNFSRRSERDYGDFDCHSGFADIDSRTFKTTFCRRPSQHFVKDEEAIDDQRFIAAEIGQNQQGFMIDIGINGVQTTLGKQIMAHMLEQVIWQQ